MLFLSFVVVLQVLLLISVQAIINTDVSQVIDATSSMVRYSADVKISEVEKEYRVIFANKWADHLAFLSVTTSKGKALNVLSPVRYHKIHLISSFSFYFSLKLVLKIGIVSFVFFCSFIRI